MNSLYLESRVCAIHCIFVRVCKMHRSICSRRQVLLTQMYILIYVEIRCNVKQPIRKIHDYFKFEFIYFHYYFTCNNIYTLRISSRITSHLKNQPAHHSVLENVYFLWICECNWISIVCVKNIQKSQWPVQCTTDCRRPSASYTLHHISDANEKQIQYRFVCVYLSV